MQQHTGPVLPFQQMLLVITEIMQDYKSDLAIEPEAVRVLQAMLEDYMNGLLNEANYFMYHASRQEDRKFTVLVRDFGLANAVRRRTFGNL